MKQGFDLLTCTTATHALLSLGSQACAWPSRSVPFAGGRNNLALKLPHVPAAPQKARRAWKHPSDCYRIRQCGSDGAFGRDASDSYE